MTALTEQHKQEVAALEASFEVEEVHHTAEIDKKLDETHMDNVHQAHRSLLEKVSSKWKPLNPPFCVLYSGAKRNVDTCFELFQRYYTP